MILGAAALTTFILEYGGSCSRQVCVFGWVSFFLHRGDRRRDDNIRVRVLGFGFLG